MAAPATGPGAAIVGGRELVDLMKRVMAFQVRVYEGKPAIGWRDGAFWAGVMSAYAATGDDAFYQAARENGERAQWTLGPRTFHADDLAIGQSYLELYARDRRPEMIAALRARLDQYFDKQIIMQGEVGSSAWREPTAPMIGRYLWWWCDALFMAPPVMARMHTVTGDRKYLDFMHSLYWDTTEYLFDEAEGLFYRDANYFPDRRRSPTGNEIFWSRGNGWVYAGIARTLDHVPEDDPRRPEYIALFQRMTQAIVRYQGLDGFWRSSLNEPTWVTNPEASGTGFFCYGLLAGIARGWISREAHLPVALRAWEALAASVTLDGAVPWVQDAGPEPAPTTIDTYRAYGQGAFLLAAAELARTAPA